mgnify:CR=1 FL=1
MKLPEPTAYAFVSARHIKAARLRELERICCRYELESDEMLTDMQKAAIILDTPQ